MRVRYELPDEDRISLLVAMRFALYGVVLTRPLDAPVDRDDYRVRARPGSLLYELDDADGYIIRRQFIEKIVESVHYHSLMIYAYSKPLPPMPLKFDRAFTREVNEIALFDEERNEFYNIDPQYEDKISRDVLYFEFSVPVDFRHKTRRWHRVSVGRESFVRFIERIGVNLQSASISDGEKSTIVAGQLILNDIDATGRTIARRYSEVREPHVDQESQKREVRTDSLSLNIGPERLESVQRRRSVRPSRSAAAEKLHDLYGDTPPRPLTVKVIRGILANENIAVSDTTLRRVLEELGWRQPTIETGPQPPQSPLGFPPAAPPNKPNKA